MAKTALITGITGQDGAYLAQLLLKKGYKVFGGFRRLSTPNFWRLQYLDVFDKVQLIPYEANDMSSIAEAINIAKPDEFYNLAAQSFVAAAFEQPVVTTQTDGISIAMILETIRQADPNIKFYQASTSEMYGQSGLSDGLKGLSTKALSEESTFKPTSPYAAAKLYGYWITKIYRQSYKLFASQGILFNHESPLRGLEFVTRKITNGIAKIAVGIESELELGNVKSVRDWGYAPEYVEGMWRIMQQDTPDDYVLATNRFHSVFGFVSAAFEEAGLNWRKHVKITKRFMRPLDTNALRGDYSKAKKELGWEPKTRFEELVKIMVRSDIERWERLLAGERFPWDAPNYPSEAKIVTRALKA
ncbi:MAG: GDP-mannose 4,6-dehydratase [Candidatus Micrarchaeota archaeon]|nr:GDP-mannose 4,6-dehydratase [Candidatus Micrarchaeota archaeon]MDE1847565.1 GDP-mannose 4,6-dehydratase [Candidatus Micrarchaeota archaeon]MDE1864282.1 GDP-mannose 4,6-dehydratase [Candidatus Micrarchaeota archaeon]